MLEVEQDLLEEFLGQVVALGDVGDQHRPVVALLGQHEEGAQSVFRFLREHPIVFLAWMDHTRPHPYGQTICRLN